MITEAQCCNKLYAFTNFLEFSRNSYCRVQKRHRPRQTLENGHYNDHINTKPNKKRVKNDYVTRMDKGKKTKGKKQGFNEQFKS